jgi:LysE type translocator
MVIQLALTVLGVVGLLSSIAHWFEWLRWIGVAYLVYLGVRTWAAPSDIVNVAAQPKSFTEIYLRGVSGIADQSVCCFSAAVHNSRRTTNGPAFDAFGHVPAHSGVSGRPVGAAGWTPAVNPQ